MSEKESGMTHTIRYTVYYYQAYIFLSLKRRIVTYEIFEAKGLNVHSTVAWKNIRMRHTSYKQE